MYLKKFRVMILIFIIFFISLSAAFASDNQTQGETLSDGDYRFYSELEDDINNTEENGVVEVNGSYTGMLSGCTINKDITINAVGRTTFNGYGAFIKSQNHKVTFKNITFDAFGSSVESELNLKGSQIFIDCNFTNTWANIYFEGNSVFTNCLFKDNQGFFNGSAIKVRGTSTFTNCTFRDNTASVGSAIDCKGDLNIIDSSFINNTATMAGVIYCHYVDDYSQLSCPGAEKHYPNAGTVTITNSRFLNNHAENSVGVIFSSQDLKIYNTIFENNSAKFMGVIFSTGDLYIDNSRFIKNCAFSVEGGDFADTALISTINSIYGTTTILNSEFRDNNANYASISLSNTVFSMSGNTFSGNSRGTIFIGDCVSNYPKYTILDDNLNSVNLFKFSTKKIVTTYYTENRFIVTLTDPTTSKGIEGVIVEISCKDGKSTSYCFGVTDSKGVARIFQPISKLGTHKVHVYMYSITYWQGFSAITTTITINKIPAIVKAPKVTFKHHKSKFFKVTIKNGKTPVYRVNFKLKIDKKTYKVQTNANGVYKFNTKNLKVGKHKVVISSRDKHYSINAKSTINIKK